MTLVEEAVSRGARKTRACEVIGVSIRTLQRWIDSDTGTISEDMRKSPERPEPHNKLSDEERQAILDICNSPEFASCPPNLIVPSLADQGIYIASEATFYRVLREHNQLSNRSRTKARGSSKRPTAQKATAPNQVWSWDISYLPSVTKGKHYYLYMITDIFSRKIVGSEVYEQELGEHAAELLQRAVWNEKCVTSQVVLHSDNGAPMRSFTLLAKMQDLGVISSYSRPRVSNDNPYSESLFKTVKYHPAWPIEGFHSIDDARSWVAEFTHWYNNEHKHSGIKYVTLQQRHTGEDIDILAQRSQVYCQAQLANPERWSRQIRDWHYIDEVFLNPEKEAA